MTERRNFYRKLSYFAAMAVLLAPLSLISQPATTTSTGGELAKLRTAEGLSPTNLGEVNPAGEAIRLALLGMRGVAANILWEKANDYKKREDYAKFGATLEQITVLQPNFVEVWDFQAHNLSYNISAEFDDYRDRYWWVIRGINFLIGGAEYNKHQPKMVNRIGWNTSQKIGRADEKVQYRRLFFADKDFNKNRERNSVRTDEQGRETKGWDSWLVGYEYFKKAQAMVDSGIPLRGMSELIFHSESGMSLINYSDAIEDEGIFQQMAKTAWSNANAEWERFAARDIPTSHGIRIQLGQKEMLDERIADNRAKLDKLAPGARDALAKEKQAKLTDDERAARAAAPELRTEKQHRLVQESDAKLAITEREVAARVESEGLRSEAAQLVHNITRDVDRGNIIEYYRGIVNFDYWRARCLSEPLDETLQAREAIYRAGKLFEDRADLQAAQRLYEEAFQKWRVVLDKYPTVRDNFNTADDLAREIDRYRRLLGQLDQPFPDNFVLQDMLDVADASNPDRIGSAKPKPKSPPPAKPESDQSEGQKPATKSAAENAEDKPASADKPAEAESKEDAPDEASN